MHLGEEAHFNHPAVLGGNWVWRLPIDYYKEELDIIEHNPNGNIVRKGISRALEKLSKYEKEDDTTKSKRYKI